MIVKLRERSGDEIEELSEELAGCMALSLERVAGGGRPPVQEERSGCIQRRMRQPGDLMAGLSAVDSTMISPDRPGFGSVARVRDLASGEDETVTPLTGDLIDVSEGQVSLASPIGHALLGRARGEWVETVFGAGAWALVPDESVVEFRLLDAGTGVRTGRLAGVAGVIRIDGPDVTRSTFEFTVPTTGIQVDPVGPGAPGLAVEIVAESAPPGIRFTSRVVRRDPGGRLRVMGMLTAGHYLGALTLSLRASPAGWLDGERRLRIDAEAIVDIADLSREARSLARHVGEGARVALRLDGSCVRLANVLEFERPLHAAPASTCST